MALRMIDKLTNYLMPSEEVATKEQLVEKTDATYAHKPVSLYVHTNQSATLKVVIVSLAKSDDVRMYADYLKANVAVVINLSNLDVSMQNSIKDFMNGACYVAAGNVQRVADAVFLYTPANVAIDKELYAYSVPTYAKTKM